MDLNTINDVILPQGRKDLAAYRPGDMFLAGGTWVYSTPQRKTSRLIDLTSLGWEDIVHDETGITLSATCTLEKLLTYPYPENFVATSIIKPCIQSLLASFKILHYATIGGNICLSLPAGTTIALTAAFAGKLLIWSPDGSERISTVTDFITGINSNTLAPGEVLRSIFLPAENLQRKKIYRRISPQILGRTAVLLIGERNHQDRISITIGAATTRIHCCELEARDHNETELAEIIDQVCGTDFFTDAHGEKHWRRKITLQLMTEVIDAVLTDDE